MKAPPEMAVVRLLATVDATSELCPFTMTLTAAAVLAASSLREASRMTEVCIQPSCFEAVKMACIRNCVNFMPRAC